MYAILSLDLDKVSGSERKEFYKVLEENKWEKFPNLTTIWLRIFRDDITEEDIINITQDHIKNARKLSGVSSCDAVVSVSQNKPIEFSQSG